MVAQLFRLRWPLHLENAEPRDEHVHELAVLVLFEARVQRRASLAIASQEVEQVFLCSGLLTAEVVRPLVGKRRQVGADRVGGEDHQLLLHGVVRLVSAKKSHLLTGLGGVNRFFLC